MDTALFPEVTVTVNGQQWKSAKVDRFSRSVSGPGYEGAHRFAKQQGGWHNLDREHPERIIAAMGGEEHAEAILAALATAIIAAEDAACTAHLKAKREGR